MTTLAGALGALAAVAGVPGLFVLILLAAQCWWPDDGVNGRKPRQTTLMVGYLLAAIAVVAVLMHPHALARGMDAVLQRGDD